MTSLTTDRTRTRVELNAGESDLGGDPGGPKRDHVSSSSPRTLIARVVTTHNGNATAHVGGCVLAYGRADEPKDNPAQRHVHKHLHPEGVLRVQPT